MKQSKSLSSLSFFYRYLFSKKANSLIKRISIICFFGLVISIGSLLIVFNVMGGLGKSIIEEFLKTEPHIIIYFDKSPSATNSKEQKHQLETELKTADLYSNISAFYFFENTDVVIKTQKGAWTGAIATGYNDSYLKTFTDKAHRNFLPKSKSDILDSFPQKQNTKEPAKLESNKKILKKNTPNITMGLGLASGLDLYEGEKISLIPAENLLLPPGELADFSQAVIHSIISIENNTWNNNYIFYNREDFSFLKTASSYRYGFELHLVDPYSFEDYKTFFEKKGWTVQTWPERNSSIFFALKLEKTIMSVFLSLAGFITLLAVSSLLALLITQKKKDIGILMAMGTPVRKIKKLFIGIGLLLCVSGMIGAFLLSLIVCLSLKYINIPFLSQFNPGSGFPVEFNISFMFFLFAGVSALSYISCVISVRSQLTRSPAGLLKLFN